MFDFLNPFGSTVARLRGGRSAPFSQYDSDALRVLTCARLEALAAIDDWAPRVLTHSERDYFRDSVVRNLTDAYDAGVRDRQALNRAALCGFYVSPLER